MKFNETPIRGAFVINLETRGDERGCFARFFCHREFQQHGLNPKVVQINNYHKAQRQAALVALSSRAAWLPLTMFNTRSSRSKANERSVLLE